MRASLCLAMWLRRWTSAHRVLFVNEPFNMKNFTLSDALREKLKNPNFVADQLASGASAQKIAGFSDETMALFYGAAHKLFDRQKYQEAANAVLFLLSLNSFMYEYWLGYGMASQMLNAFETAIDAYEVAAILEVENPVSYFYLSKCLFAIHDRPNARQAIELAIEYAGDHPQYQDLKAQALAVERLLEHEG